MSHSAQDLYLLRQKLYGSSKERLNISSDASQLNFFDAFEANLEPEPIPEIIDAEFIELTYKKAKKKKPTLGEQFKDIPVKPQLYMVEYIATTY